MEILICLFLLLFLLPLLRIYTVLCLSEIFFPGSLPSNDMLCYDIYLLQFGFHPVAVVARLVQLQK
jgi:hypothetical protein